MREVWKEINGFPGYYVSSRGRVWSEKTKKLLIQYESGTGRTYYKVTLCKGGLITYPKYVHRLVLENFKPCAGMEKLTVNHIDENRYNNNLENLEWMSSKENCQYSFGQCVKKTSIDGKTEKLYPSFREAVRDNHIHMNTLKKYIKLGIPYKKFFWEKVDNPRKI